ncbi:serine hydrolase domain-containing protein [Nonomuraea rhodomycinica]|uniref:serine hydrolase domain-containing protein n=1 Tax=Nonomuraea rhodomycinica TaxID=1712872 RepID=UPI0028A95736|nr:serine hydrolase domain-containing protein [Nonomuraea rhodomycinica]
MKILPLALAVLTALAVPSAPAAASIAPTTTRTTAAPELSPAAIDAYVNRALDATDLPGLSVVVTHGDRVVHAAGYGHDSEGRPVTAATPMRVASVTKSFTAMAVMILVEEGKLTLDEPVVEQLSELRMADPRARSITVRHLLNQTSGLSDTTTDIRDLDTAGSLKEYAAKLGDATLRAAPGTRWEYCNVNYNLAARLVEVASGRAFGDFMRERVFGPLGMRSSAVSDREVRPADGYNSVYGLWLPRPELPAFLDGSGSGGVITTAADMGRWLIAQNGRGRRLVGPASLAAMHAPSTVRDYGMGWGIDDGTRRLTHSGNLFTYTAVETIVPETGYGFAVMANSAALADATFTIAGGLADLSEGTAPEVPGGDRQQFELVLGIIALAAAGLGALGAARSRRWAARRLATMTSKRPETAKGPLGSAGVPVGSAGEPAGSAGVPAGSARGSAGVPAGSARGSTGSAQRPAGSAQGPAGSAAAGSAGGPARSAAAESAGGPARSLGSGTWRVGLRLVPVLLPSALLAAYPDLVSFLTNGRTVTWAQLTYFPAPLTITLVVAAVAGLTTAAFRLARLRALSGLVGHSAPSALFRHRARSRARHTTTPSPTTRIR